MNQNRIVVALAVIVTLLLIGCAVPPASGTGSAQPYQPAQPQSEAAYATYQAAAARETAVAAESTRAVVHVTEQARAVEQATSGAMTATAVHQSVRATDAALQIGATATAMYQQIEATRYASSVYATATADAQLIAIAEAEREALVTMRQQQAAVEQARLERIQAWNKIWPWLLGGIVLMLVATAVGFAAQRVQFARKPVVTIEHHPTRSTLIRGSDGGLRVLPAPRPALPAGEPVRSDGIIEGEFEPVELPPLDYGHILIAGETDSGKSTAMRAIIRHRPNVTVLDPHYSPGAWGNVEDVLGGGGRYDQIGAFFTEMVDELQRRLVMLDNGEVREGQFTPMNIATDEMPSIISECRDHEVGHAWRRLIREGRKVGLFMVVSSQSTRVKTLGIDGEGDVLGQFHGILYLGGEAINRFRDVAQQMERPAVLVGRDKVARPVIVPNVRPLHEQDSATAITHPAQRPLLEAPTPQPLDIGNGEIATPEEVSDILKWARRLPNRTAVQRTVFGYDGGAAHRKVKFVLEYYGIEM